MPLLSRLQSRVVRAGQYEARKQTIRFQYIALQSFLSTGRTNPGANIGDILFDVNRDAEIIFTSPQFHFGIRNFDYELKESTERIAEEMAQAYAFETNIALDRRARVIVGNRDRRRRRGGRFRFRFGIVGSITSFISNRSRAVTLD